jgi:hypothetical protein
VVPHRIGLRTGDLGSMDEHGYCRVQGRLKDMIIRGGENIYPREIEDVLLTHPAVANVAVSGLPDVEWGEIVAAFVQARPGARPDGAELEAFCRRHLASHKVPRLWRFVSHLPQTASGKVQKFISARAGDDLGAYQGRTASRQETGATPGQWRQVQREQAALNVEPPRGVAITITASGLSDLGGDCGSLLFRQPRIASGFRVLLLSKSIVFWGAWSRRCIFWKPTGPLRDVVPDVSLTGA